MKPSLPVFVSLLLVVVHPVYAAAPSHVWSFRAGGPNSEVGWVVACDADGNIFLAGGAGNGSDLGGGALPDGSCFLAKYTSTGQHLWSHTYGSSGATGRASIAGLAVDAGGDIVATGSLQGTVDFGGGSITSLGSYDPFIAKFSASGDHLWSYRVGVRDGTAYSPRIAGGYIYLCAFYTPSVNDYVPIIEKRDADGLLLWRREFPSGGNRILGASLESVAVDDAGNVTAVGDFEGFMNFPNGGYIETDCWDIGGPGPCNDYRDVFFVSLDTNGNYRWHQHGDGIGYDSGSDVAVDVSGNVYGTGTYTNSFNLGGDVLHPGSTGDATFLVKYSADGNYVWSRGTNNNADVWGKGIVVDGSQNVWLTGSFLEWVDFGGGQINSHGEEDIFLAKFAASDGAHVWSSGFGEPGADFGNDIALTTSGDVAFTGSFFDTVSVGGDPLVSAGSTDVFVAKFTGNPVPTLVTHFDARASRNAVTLSWDLWSDDNLDRIIVYRHDGVHSLGIELAQLDASVRAFNDTAVDPGHTYTYQLAIITQNGDILHSPSISAAVPALASSLSQNFPNPFRATTTIDFALAEPSNVTVGIYDASGRLVRKLDAGHRGAGSHRIDWDGRDELGHAASSGVYFYRLEGVHDARPHKMILAR